MDDIDNNFCVRIVELCRHCF